MPLNPLTGQVDYGGASYDPQNMNAGMAMRAAAKADADVPFFFDMMESLPGVTTGALFNARRYANTLQKGGRFDVAAGVKGRKLTRAQRYGSLIGHNVAPTAPNQFIGGKGIFGGYARRQAVKGKTPQLLSSRANNFTARPSALNRFTSLRALTGDPSLGYTPFQSSSLLNGMVAKSARLRTRMGLSGMDPAKDKAFSGGVLGRITSLNKLNDIENIITRGPGASKFSQARYLRALETRGGIATNALKVANLTNPVAGTAAVRSAGSTAVRSVIDNARASRAAGAGVPADVIGRARAARSAATRAATTAENTRRMQAALGDTSRFVSSEMTPGIFTNRITSGYLGIINASKMTTGQSALFNNVVGKVVAGFDGLGPLSPAQAMKVDRFRQSLSVGGKYSGGFLRQSRGGVEMIKMAQKYASSGGSKFAAAKFAGMGVGRVAGAALGPLNVLATGQLIYDLAKGAGKVAVKGVNFAKDAMKSMQGTINKPMFGSGFKDNEVAATSRARGVMAIQNSRLNARSLLGAEASMLAAHFG